MNWPRRDCWAHRLYLAQVRSTQAPSVLRRGSLGEIACALVCPPIARGSCAPQGARGRRPRGPSALHCSAGWVRGGVAQAPHAPHHDVPSGGRTTILLCSRYAAGRWAILGRCKAGYCYQDKKRRAKPKAKHCFSFGSSCVALRTPILQIGPAGGALIFLIRGGGGALSPRCGRRVRTVLAAPARGN